MKERDEALKKAAEKVAIQEVAVADDKVTAENEHLKELVRSLEKIDEMDKKLEETNKISEERLKQAQVEDDCAAMHKMEEKLANIEMEDQILLQQVLKSSANLGLQSGAMMKTFGTDSLSKSQMERQRELSDALIKCVAEDVGFSQGKPVAAFTMYKCLLHWKSFEAERTNVFDRLTELIGSAIEKSNDNNHLSYWLSNTSTLLFLLQRSLKPPPQPTSFWRRISQSFRSSPSRNLKIDIVRSVEAKMPALLFKQQLAAYVEKIFGIIRDNFKGELSTLLESCIQAPRTMLGSALRQSLSNSPNIPPLSTHWRNITDSLDLFLFTLKENYVPKVLIQKIFTQTFSYINVRLLNSVFLRRECCTFTNGKYVKAGLAELETWCTQVGEEFAGSSWDELKHIKQAVGFLVIRKKSKITYDAITKDLCPVLSIHQIYRICALYADDNYNTRRVSSHVISRIREKMSENETESDAVLLDNTLSIPCSVDELSANEEERDFGGVKAAPQLVENPDFQFLQDVAA